MLSSILAALLALSAIGGATPLAVERAVCNADDCARLIAGTRAGLPSTRLADCSSFLHTTVTPAPAYTTVTVTPVVTQTSTITTNPVFEDTTVTKTVYTVVRTTPSTSSTAAAAAVHYRDVEVTTRPVPPYASSACAAAGQYSSACSCAGVRRETVTATRATYTAVVEGTKTATTEVFVAATTTVARTATVTQTATKTGYACGSTVQGNGIYTFRSYKVNCGQRVARGNASQVENDGSESDCLRSCNSVKYCVYAEYQFSSGTCNVYYNTKPIAIVDDASWDALVLP